MPDTIPPLPTIDGHQQTCEDCMHIRRCRWLVNRLGTETECDWEPSRFRRIVDMPPTLRDAMVQIVEADHA